MGLTDAVQRVLRQYATFEGRAGRPEFWWWYVTIIFVGGVFAAIAFVFGSGATRDVLLFGYLVYVCAIFLPTLAVAIRRLHDTGRSAWWTLLALFVFTNLILLILLAFPSDQGSNRYGPPA